MSEYVRKQTLLDRINTIRNAHIEKRNEGDECDQFANEAVADWLWAIQDEIQSGAFDAPDDEIQRLRAALGILANKNNWFETYDSIVPTIAWAGGNKTPYEIANEALSATSEPTGSKINSTRYIVRRDQYGYAEAIERDGYTVLHLMAGTQRNEQEAQDIVDRLNGSAEERYRKALENIAYGRIEGDYSDVRNYAREILSTTTERSESHEHQ